MCVCVCVRVQILPQFQCAEEKNRLLRAVAGAGLDSLSSLRAKWDKLELVMESHKLMIKEQVIWLLSCRPCVSFPRLKVLLKWHGKHP